MRNEEQEMRNGRYIPLKIGNPSLVMASILLAMDLILAPRAHSGHQACVEGHAAYIDM